MLKGLRESGPLLGLPAIFWWVVGIIALLMALIQPVLIVSYVFAGFMLWRLSKHSPQRAETIQALNAYAKGRGFAYLGEEYLAEPRGYIFESYRGASIKMSYAIKGSVSDHPFQLYAYLGTALPDEDGNFRTFDILVVENVQTPQPLLVISTQSAQAQPALIDPWRKSRLEGTFDASFSTYTKGEQTAYVQEILEPDIMHMLMESYSDISFELTGNELVLNYPDYDAPYRPATADRLLKAAEVFLSKTRV